MQTVSRSSHWKSARIKKGQRSIYLHEKVGSTDTALSVFNAIYYGDKGGEDGLYCSFLGVVCSFCSIASRSIRSTK